MTRRFDLPFLLVALAGCNASAPRPAPVTAAAPAAIAPAPLPAQDVRGQHYCEILVGGRSGLHVHLDVYSTLGLGACDQDLWGKLDRARLKAELDVEGVVLNGPRHALTDAFLPGASIEATTRTFGGIPMRKAAEIDLSLFEIVASGKPYSLNDLHCDTIWIFAAGKAVYEIVDAKGRVYVMESYSGQKAPLTEADLATLGARLHLPQGWVFRSRVLPAELRVTAPEGMATMVQDELRNTYQLLPK